MPGLSNAARPNRMATMPRIPSAHQCPDSPGGADCAPGWPISSSFTPVSPLPRPSDLQVSNIICSGAAPIHPTRPWRGAAMLEYRPAGEDHDKARGWAVADRGEAHVPGGNRARVPRASGDADKDVLRLPG